MVETRRTSRRLQAKAAAIGSPVNSSADHATICKPRRTPSPRKKQQQELEKKIKKEDEGEKQTEKQREQENEKQMKGEDKKQIEQQQEQEKRMEDDIEKQSGLQQQKPEKQTEMQQEQENEKQMKDEDKKQIEKQQEQEKQMEDDIEKQSELQQEQENEKLMEDEDTNQTEQQQDVVNFIDSNTESDTTMKQSIETASEGKKDEEDITQQDEDEGDDEDVDQYAFLAASGLNLSMKASDSFPKSSLTSSMPSAPALLKRQLVPNQLDSGASEYQEFFSFDGSKRSTAATMRADARASEEAKVIAAGQKAVAHSERQRAESQNKKLAGRRWFNFESEEMTVDARRDFALLRMRNYLDPKKFYKSSDHSRTLPKHFQMGVVIEGAHEFHSARLTKKQRRKTFTDEIMADEAVVQYTHRVAGNIQAARSNNQSRKKRRRN